MWNAVRNTQAANLTLLLTAANEPSRHLRSLVRGDLLARLFVGQTSRDQVQRLGLVHTDVL
jgi:hypothetical protein